MSESTSLQVGRRAVPVSRLDKVMFPDAGITKGDLIEHYRLVADRMLPHLAGRPLVMQRFPDGIGRHGFYHKDIPAHFPEWIDRVTVPKKKGTVTHAICSNRATLVYLINQGTITPHVWLSRADRLDHPDRLIFDLDPPGSDFGVVRDAARALRSLLDSLGLVPYLMTTGGRGLHVICPLDRRADFAATRAFARSVAELLASREPERFTTRTRKQDRRGRVFLDYLRNGYAQTAVAPYAVRARPGAPVAMPIGWNRLNDSRLRSDTYRLGALDGLLARGRDPWRGMARRARSLTRPRSRLDTERGDP